MSERAVTQQRPPVLDAIGHTPIVRVTRLVEPGMAEVWVKLESHNPTGSYKDRMTLAISSTPAPNARILRIFSTAKASELTIRRRYPFTEHTNASELPVLPPVYSTTVSPGRMSPRASAPSIIASAMRSLYEPVGL